MKILIFSILMFVTMEALAYARHSSFNLLNGDARNHAVELSHASGTRGLGGGSVQSFPQTSQSDSFAASSAVSANQSLVQVRQEWEAVSNAVSSLNLAYCQDGGGAGDKNASFNIGGVSYVCEISMAVPQMLSSVAPLLKSAESYPEGSEERRQELLKAKDILNKVYKILGHDLYNYIDGRGNTAGIGAFFKDSWMFWAMLLIAL